MIRESDTNKIFKLWTKSQKNQYLLDYNTIKSNKYFLIQSRQDYKESFLSNAINLDTEWQSPEKFNSSSIFLLRWIFLMSLISSGI